MAPRLPPHFCSRPPRNRRRSHTASHVRLEGCGLLADVPTEWLEPHRRHMHGISLHGAPRNNVVIVVEELPTARPRCTCCPRFPQGPRGRRRATCRPARCGRRLTSKPVPVVIVVEELPTALIANWIPTSSSVPWRPDGDPFECPKPHVRAARAGHCCP